MKMKTIENIRKVEIISAMAISILAKLSRLDNDALTFLVQNHDLLTILNNIATYTLTTDILTNQYTVRTASDYKELNSLYKEVIDNITKFYKTLELEDPLSICGTYQYMYRKGYLSRNKQFRYSSDMKDIPNLFGIDVIRGTGVCRSISSQLVDIYRRLGYKSHCLSVRVEDGMLKEISPNMKIDMGVDKKSEKLVKFAVGTSKVFHIGNHVITEVSSEYGKLLVCPTNCLVLQKSKGIITVADQPTNKVMRFNPFSDIITGTKSNPITSFKELATSYIPPENHQEIIDRTARMCRSNEDLFEQFYQENQELFTEIGAKADEKRGLVKRLIPFIPNKK